MEVNDDLLLDVIQQLITNPIRVVDAVSNGGMPCLELVHDMHHTLQIFLIQYRSDNGRLFSFFLRLLNRVIRVVVTYLDLLAELKYGVLQLVDTKGLLEDFDLLKVIGVHR